MTECEREGISGNCGMNCTVFRDGECEEPYEILEYVRTAFELSHAEAEEILAMYKEFQ